MNRLSNGEELRENRFLVSENKAYWLVMQPDGNLVLYVSCHFHPKNAIWASGTDGKGKGPHNVFMQPDNNLVVYDGQNKATWASNTHNKRNKGEVYLVLQDDGNLVLYDKHKTALWASNTQRS